jgi:hypothetical protein
MGIEPTAQAWEAWVLPLYDARYEADSNHGATAAANATRLIAVIAAVQRNSVRDAINSRASFCAVVRRSCTGALLRIPV